MKKLNGKVKVGIIGQGYWGPKLTRNFVDLLGVDHVSIADFKEERLQDVLEHYPEIKTTRNGDDLIEGDADAVVIATPVHTHYPLAKKALLAGKHVFVEKPLSDSSTHAQELVTLAEEQKLSLLVGHTYVYNPAVEAIKTIIESGTLGNLFYIYSKRVNLGLLQSDINVMWDLAPHDLSILCYTMNDVPASVMAVGENYVNHVTKKAEIVFMNLKFSNNVRVSIRLSWLDPIKQRSMTIVGSKKMLVYDDIVDDKITIYDKGVKVPPYSITLDEFRASYHTGEKEIYQYEWVEPLRAECGQFVDCIINNQTNSKSSGKEGLKIVRILETAQRSLDNGGVELKVEY